MSVDDAGDPVRRADLDGLRPPVDRSSGPAIAPALGIDFVLIGTLIGLFMLPGEVLALLGPSGCGKTTLLRAIAGFLRQTTGTISVDGRRFDHLQSGRRNIGIVFQSYVLFPHMTAAENVGYGLAARGRPRPKSA